MRNRMSLSSNHIIQPIRARGIDKAIANPFARLHDLVDIGLEFKRFLDAFVVQFGARVEVGRVGFSVEPEDVERVFACDGDEVARAGPVNLLRREGERGEWEGVRGEGEKVRKGQLIAPLSPSSSS